MKTTTRTHIMGVEEREVTEVKRTGRFLFFFKTEWWETVSSKHIANDLHITTENPIRDIYLNGELVNPPQRNYQS
mgnify:CR=1 FL=1